MALRLLVIFYLVGASLFAGDYESKIKWTTPITDVGAPPARYAHQAVWTGATGDAQTDSRLVVWGGINELRPCTNGVNQGWQGIATNSGGIWDSTNSRWKSLPTEGAPTGRWFPNLRFRSGKLFVYGGYVDTACWTSEFPLEIGVYDFTTDQWRVIAKSEIPFVAFPVEAKVLPHFLAAETPTSEIMQNSLFAMIGNNLSSERIFARFDLKTQTWVKLSQNFPSGSEEPWLDRVAFTDRTVVFPSPDHREANVYDVIEDTWRKRQTLGDIPPPRTNPTYGEISPGTMLLWRGIGKPAGFENDPALYNAEVDEAYVFHAAELRWERVFSESILRPVAFMYPRFGSQLFYLHDLWEDHSTFMRTFDLSRLKMEYHDTVGFPVGRHSFSATWTGEKILIWGGMETGSRRFINTGGALSVVHNR